MEKVDRFKCIYCGELLFTESECLKHEDRHKSISLANEMLNNRKTLQEINEACHIWDGVPSHLLTVTIDNCFIIPHWQCCKEPAYRIIQINFDGTVDAFGRGGWSGYFGQQLYLGSRHLRDPKPSEALYIYI